MALILYIAAVNETNTFKNIKFNVLYKWINQRYNYGVNTYCPACMAYKVIC